MSYITIKKYWDRNEVCLFIHKEPLEERAFVAAFSYAELITLVEILKDIDIFCKADLFEITKEVK